MAESTARNPKRSRWFPGTQNPWEPGVYEREFARPFICKAYWDGAFWYFAGNSVVGAVSNYHNGYFSTDQSLPWRGLAQKAA